MFCAACGTQIADPETTLFCTHCGAPVRAGAVAPSTAVTIRSPAGRAARAQIALGLVAAVAAFAAWADYAHGQIWAQLARGDVVSLTTATNADNLESTANLLLLLVRLMAAVTFILWFRRCYLNLDPGRRRYATAWTIWGWFVPILAFWRPKQLANDLVRAPSGAGVGAGLLLAWWIAFVVDSLAGAVASDLTRSASAFSARRDADYALAVSQLIAIPAAILAILVVRRITAGQVRLAAALATPAPPAAPVDP